MRILWEFMIFSYATLICVTLYIVFRIKKSHRKWQEVINKKDES